MTASSFSLPRVVDVSDLGELGDPLATDNGQSRAVQPLDGHDGYLVKMYVTPLGEDGSQRLDRLIALPAATDLQERLIIAERTAWPVARVDASGIPGVGCILPRAPEKFRAGLQVAPGHIERRYLDVDWLARPAERLRRRGLTVPDQTARLRVCREIIEVAALFARHDLVYSDWSYSNAFFSQEDWSAYVIDVDGCTLRYGPNVFQPHWEDPLTPRSAPADTYTDRYRTALLVGRCLTGLNRTAEVLHALQSHPEQTLATALLDVLCSAKRELRPSLSALVAILDGLPYIRMPLQRLPLPPVPVPQPAPQPDLVPDPDPVPEPVPEPAPKVPHLAAVVGAVALAVVMVIVLIIVVLNA